VRLASSESTRSRSPGTGAPRGRHDRRGRGRPHRGRNRSGVKNARRRESLDLAGALVAPPGREWLDAMRAEHASIEDPSERRRFARGCVRAALVAPWRPDGTAVLLRAVVAVAVAVAIAVAIGLAAFGLAHYPGIRSGWWIPELGAFIVILAIYAALGLRLSLLGRPAARRAALLAALPAAALCAAAAGGDGAWSYALALATVALPALAAAIAGRTGDRDGAALAAGLCAVIAGLLAFAGYVTVTYATDGGTATPALLDEFRHSGATDYATWAVGDSLGGAIFMLAFVLTAGAALTALLAVVAPSRRG
jgi:hypothetical protein